MVMARRPRPSGDWATGGGLPVWMRTHGAIRPRFHPSSPRRRRLFPDRMGFFSATGRIRVMRAWSEAGSESLGPRVGGRSVRLAQTG
jgi:hypothetical protein